MQRASEKGRMCMPSSDEGLSFRTSKFEQLAAMLMKTGLNNFLCVFVQSCDTVSCVIFPSLLTLSTLIRYWIDVNLIRIQSFRHSDRRRHGYCFAWSTRSTAYSNC